MVIHTMSMESHMKTTLNIDDTVMDRLRREAVRRKTTISALVESALRTFLQSRKPPTEVGSLPTFRSGGALVDVANRDALYDQMEKR